MVNINPNSPNVSTFTVSVGDVIKIQRQDIRLFLEAIRILPDFQHHLNMNQLIKTRMDLKC